MNAKTTSFVTAFPLCFQQIKTNNARAPKNIKPESAPNYEGLLMAKMKPYEHGKSPVPKSWADTAAYLKAGKQVKQHKGNSLMDKIDRLTELMKDKK